MYETITKASPDYLAGVRDLLCDGDTMRVPSGTDLRRTTTVGDLMLMNALADFPEPTTSEVEPTEVDGERTYVDKHMRYEDGRWTTTGAMYAWCSCGWSSSPIYRDDRRALARAAADRHARTH